MKFNEMKYTRPDIEAYKAELTAMVEEIESAQTFEQADEIFIKADKFNSKLSTLYTLVMIRHTIDTQDEFYAGEQEFWDNTFPELMEYLQQVKLAFLESKFRDELSQKYGELYFKNAEIELKTFSPEIIADLQRESMLSTQYEKLLASAQIEFEGDIYTLPQMTSVKECADDERRLAAWRAEGTFYMENKAELDRIYDELTHVRHNMAKTLGYDDFVTLGYYRMMRNSYTESDVEKFRHNVVKYIVPLAARLYQEQAARLGKSYPLNYADAALTFRSGNATPKGTADDILAHGKKFYHELSPETAEFIDFMFDNELLDVLSRKGKANGGYCTSISDYKAPFIFANFNGTAGDVEVMTHEAGHAFAAYVAREIVPQEMQSPTYESCEIHSMSMEFFAWDWTEGFFGEQADKFKYKHLAAALKFIPYGTMVDHFQHIVYKKPDLTPAERDGEWRKLTAVYMPWLKLEDIPFYADGAAWQRQMHIYSSPFYYIDYCLAQTVALEFWAKMQQNRDDAWASYLKLVRLAGTKTFSALVEAASLESPFDPQALKKVCQTAAKWLDEFDKSKLN